MTGTLRELFLPQPQFAERRHVDIAATPEEVWRAIDRVDLTDLPVAKFLMRVRSLIGRLGNGAPQRELPKIDEAMVLLARREGEEAAYGLVGRWWTFTNEAHRSDVDSASAFLDFSEPGYAKAVFGFWTEPGPGGSTRLTTETRVTTTSNAAYRAMGAYWLVIRPFSGLIRRAMLAAVRREAIRAH